MSTKLTVSQAVGLSGKSESKIRRDIKAGVLSSEKDSKGVRKIDKSELYRVYAIQPPNDVQKTDGDSQKIIAILESQIQDLKTQNAKLLALTDKLTLALPSPTKKGWLARLFDR